jgi:uncharacterized membrane-anchored protein
MKIAAAPRIMIVAAVCALALIGVVVAEGAARAGGQEVLLPIQGVDPRALLSGHYVQIDLSETLAPSDHCPDQQEGWDWIALRPLGGGVYGVAGGAHSRDQTEQIGPLAVKGTFTCSAPTAPGKTDPTGENGAIQLKIGIDRFYIDQARAEHIAEVLRQAPAAKPVAYAIFSVGTDGQARLKGLKIDGRRLELNWF